MSLFIWIPLRDGTVLQFLTYIRPWNKFTSAVALFTAYYTNWTNMHVMLYDKELISKREWVTFERPIPDKVQQKQLQIEVIGKYQLRDVPKASVIIYSSQFKLPNVLQILKSVCSKLLNWWIDDLTARLNSVNCWTPLTSFRLFVFCVVFFLCVVFILIYQDKTHYLYNVHSGNI